VDLRVPAAHCTRTMERRLSLAVFALLAALLLATAWPAHGCGCNDDPESPDCSQVSRIWRPLQLLARQSAVGVNALYPTSAASFQIYCACAGHGRLPAVHAVLSSS
jgi:hypothetical protein